MVAKVLTQTLDKWGYAELCAAAGWYLQDLSGDRNVFPHFLYVEHNTQVEGYAFKQFRNKMNYLSVKMM